MKLILIFALIISYLAPTIDKIEGLSVFKIGKTNTTVIDSLAKAEKVKIKPIDKYYYEGALITKKSFAIVELLQNKKDRYSSPTDAPRCDEERVFKILNYQIGDIKIDELTLNFYQDRLAKISTTYSPELVKGLIAKYGEPETSKTEKDIECIYKLTGNKVINKQTTHYQTWTNGSIVAHAVIANRYTEKCEERFLTYINITDTVLSRELTKCFIEQNKKESQGKAPSEQTLKGL